MTTPSAQELREAAYISNKEVADKLFPIPEQFLERKNFREGFMHGYLARAERAAAECITCAKERDKAQAALSTARADCVTLANEIKRMDDLLVNLHSNPTMYTHQAIAACAAIDDGRSPAVVEAMGRANSVSQ